MTSESYWQEKREEDQRRDRFYRATRRGDYDTALYEASPDAYVDYLRLRDSHGAPALPGYFQEITGFEQERRSLVELVNCTDLDVHGRARLISMVYAVHPSAPDATEKLEGLRRYIAAHWSRSC